VQLADFWEQGDRQPIHIKEAEALRATLQSVAGQVGGHRVDAFVDNMAVVSAWERQKCRDTKLAKVVKKMFTLVTSLNVDLHLVYIPSKDNPADLPSRSISWTDAMLGPEAWGEVERHFGPHSVDLMATDSNAMKREGVAIKHFTPCPMPQSAGVNVFSQDIGREGRPYCYPPCCLTGAVLNYLKESGAHSCTVVVQDQVPRPNWWPRLKGWARASITLGRKGEKGVLLAPTKQGYVRDQSGLRWDLLAFDLRL
jgi:hypothetical protein